MYIVYLRAKIIENDLAKHILRNKQAHEACRVSGACLAWRRGFVTNDLIITVQCNKINYPVSAIRKPDLTFTWVLLPLTHSPSIYRDSHADSLKSNAQSTLTCLTKPLYKVIALLVFDLALLPWFYILDIARGRLFADRLTSCLLLLMSLLHVLDLFASVNKILNCNCIRLRLHCMANKNQIISFLSKLHCAS